MIYKVTTDFTVETINETVNLKEGQKVRLSKEEAIPLIQDGLIQPIGKAAFRIYSEILQAYLWVVDTDEDMHSLRAKGVTGAIYTHHEIKELKKLSKEDLKEIHKVKEVFPESTVEEINNHADR
jgi:hypothetical protein